MRWRNRKQSSNVDDRRHDSGAQGAAPSLGTILFFLPVIKKLLRTKTGLAILALVVVAYLGGFLDMASLTGGGGKRLVDEQADNEQAAFIKTVLADTEAVWSKVFA
jgi:hypothetical protein